MTTIAVTGTRGFLGGLVLDALAARQPAPTLLAIDRLPPEHVPPARVRFLECDLTAPNADQTLTRFLQRHQCDVMVHAAVHSQPKRNQEYSHELQSIGTLYLLHAAKAAGVPKVIVTSTTEVYGAFPDNPSFLLESHPMRGERLSAYLRDKVEIERACLDFARRLPERIVTVLRPCTILGPRIRNYKTHLLKHPAILTALGFDPLVQFIHEDDVLRALLAAIDRDVPGVFNLVGRGVTPFSNALALIGKTRLPVPSLALQAMTTLLWHLDVQQTPPTHIQFLKYACIADGRLAGEQLGFHPSYTLAAVLRSFQESLHARGS